MKCWIQITIRIQPIRFYRELRDHRPNINMAKLFFATIEHLGAGCHNSERLSQKHLIAVRSYNIRAIGRNEIYEIIHDDTVNGACEMIETGDVHFRFLIWSDWRRMCCWFWCFGIGSNAAKLIYGLDRLGFFWVQRELIEIRKVCTRMIMTWNRLEDGKAIYKLATYNWQSFSLNQQKLKMFK